jgi:hypothetical protein
MVYNYSSQIFEKICLFLGENCCGVFEVLKITGTGSSLILICSQPMVLYSQTLKKTWSS